LAQTRSPLQGQKVKVIRPLWLVVLAGQHGHTVMVTYPYAYMTYIVSPLAGLGGGILWRAACLDLVIIYHYFIPWTAASKSLRHPSRTASGIKINNSQLLITDASEI